MAVAGVPPRLGPASAQAHYRHGGRGHRRARAGARRGVGAAAGPRGDAGAAGGFCGAPGRSPAGAEQAPRPARPGALRGAEPGVAAAGAETTPGPPRRAPRGEGSRQGVFRPRPPVRLPPRHRAAPAVLCRCPSQRPVPRHVPVSPRDPAVPARGGGPRPLLTPSPHSAVTVGVPAEAEGEIRAGLRWQQQGDTTVVVPVPAPGRRSLARKEVKSTLTHYRVLGTAGGCALLQLQPRTAFPEQLPVHLTLLLCPALGDHKHSSRVGRVLGVPFLLPPEAAPTRTQMLDEELLCRLGISPRQLHRLPLHLHLQQLVLPQGPLCAPPPPPFLRTLRRLGLPGHPEPPATRSPLPPH
ncbi:mitochondrial mRNA pseudouridine synthase RPUSD3 isoform X2 [Aquila chrysaetos chrysaetos]|uniref:mitochondrial mRNA pseudouridine synthase RPUSD3 isoform X2 n=1 Tax=Aquila chrysaetos chrysaetos TaxID=223781 RepID=UPI00117657C1|nr:mitochondrial mRNA pseudouridine synthase RPUSD3 isoform X2 [Aquila chrysaetos chrysaetos]